MTQRMTKYKNDDIMTDIRDSISDSGRVHEEKSKQKENKRNIKIILKSSKSSPPTTLYLQPTRIVIPSNR